MKRANTIRLVKEEHQLLKDPIQFAVVRRRGHSEFHFCLFGLDGDYEGGYYHGVLILPDDYPFAPPQLKFMTPSGYFEIDTRVCTTFTDYHRETWSAVWNVQSMVLGVISFMLAGDPSVGVKILSKQEKRKLAQKSMEFNLQNPLFMEIFGKEKFVQDWLKPPGAVTQPTQLEPVPIAPIQQTQIQHQPPAIMVNVPPLYTELPPQQLIEFRN